MAFRLRLARVLRDHYGLFDRCTDDAGGVDDVGDRFVSVLTPVNSELHRSKDLETGKCKGQNERRENPLSPAVHSVQFSKYVLYHEPYLVLVSITERPRIIYD